MYKNCYKVVITWLLNCAIWWVSSCVERLPLAVCIVDVHGYSSKLFYPIVCPQIKQTILNGLEKANSTLGYSNTLPQLAFTDHFYHSSVHLLTCSSMVSIARSLFVFGHQLLIVYMYYMHLVYEISSHLWYLQFSSKVTNLISTGQAMGASSTAASTVTATNASTFESS